jgi:dCTP deaminase
MPVLSDRDIEAALDQEALRVDPYDPSNLTPNGLDLRIGEVLVPERDDEPVQEGKVEVPGRSRFVVSTEEVVGLGPQLCGQLWIRSTYARKGVLASFGKVEAGFEGELSIAAFNGLGEPLALPVGDRFCQIAFERLESPPEALYDEHSGTYQGQRGVTLDEEEG